MAQSQVSRLFVCEGCGHISLSEKGLRLQISRAQGGPPVRKNPGCQRPTLNYFGDLPVCHRNPLKAVEDQKLGRRRPIRLLRLNDEDEDHRTKPPF
ncbi:hypothetical protein CEXT_617751 [Caerostris extrusa]|uniref:Uncharacterized protein n=1 Tax=Caerostris extrusa TaxID=172846 RepID=A0AAV4PM97_CAEEX|nr:hypothetical protein CEXT_617751 [Caerostris extrusa]